MQDEPGRAMTERIPPGTDPDEWTEQQLVEAMERGELRSSAHGRPLDLSDGDDPHWWIRRKLREEEFVTLPPALQLRRDRDELLDRLPTMARERDVRAALEELDRRIRRANSHGLDGPPSTMLPLDVDALVAEWRASRPPPPVDSDASDAPTPAARRRLLARLLSRSGRRRRT